MEKSADVPSRIAYVALAGRPNVGKSTLINTLCGEKVVAVSKVPQTTRIPSRAVVTRGATQIVFVDLPGVSKPSTLLSDRLNKTARSELAGADVVLLMVDAKAGVGSGDRYLVERVCNWDVPVVCVVNKVDIAGPAKTAQALDTCSRMGDEISGFPGFADFVPISAATGDGLEALLGALEARAVLGSHLFDDSTSFDGGAGGLEGQIAEIVREKLITEARDELPYSIAVVVDEIAERPDADLVDVHARAVVERESQKGVVIGKGGANLKRAGQEARVEIESLIGSQVYLDLRVVVMKDWQRDPKALQKLGF